MAKSYLALHQITAILKEAKSRVYSAVTELHKHAQKPDPYNGMEKTYRKADEAGKDLPAESKKVTLRHRDVIEKLIEHMSETIDLVYMQEDGNTFARGAVVVDGDTILANVPVTFMIYLEKQLIDIRTFIEKMPTLDESKTWTLDPNTGNYRSERVSTHRTEKTKQAIVLFPATDHHPAQTQLIDVDTLAGHWDQTFYSGAIPAPEKDACLKRVNKLLMAVKVARQKANETTAPPAEVAPSIFGYLFRS